MDLTAVLQDLLALEQEGAGEGEGAGAAADPQQLLELLLRDAIAVRQNGD